MSQLEAQYAVGKSVLFLVGGVATVLANTALYLWASRYFPLLWFVGGLAAFVGLRGFDRRVKLRVGPDGFWYAPWGYQPIPWGEFESFSTFTQNSIPFVQLHPKYPEQLRSRFPLPSRLNSQVNARFKKGSFYINPSQLNVSSATLVEALRQYLPAAA